MLPPSIQKTAYIAPSLLKATESRMPTNLMGPRGNGLIPMLRANPEPTWGVTALGFRRVSGFDFLGHTSRSETNCRGREPILFSDRSQYVISLIVVLHPLRSLLEILPSLTFHGLWSLYSWHEHMPQTSASSVLRVYIIVWGLEFRGLWFRSVVLRV